MAPIDLRRVVRSGTPDRYLRALEAGGFVVREVDHNQNAEVIFATQAGRDALDA
jgi:hypothetical protein